MDIFSTDAFGLNRRFLLTGAATAMLAGVSGNGAAAAASAGSSIDDAALLAEFDALLQRMRSAASLAFARSTARRPVDHAAGLLHVLNNLSLGLAMVQNNDPLHPEIFRYMGPDRKQGGDNQSALYTGFPVDAAHTYRLHGNRGSAKYLSITSVERGPSPWGGPMGGALFGRDLKSDADGNFEVILSATPHEGNWLKITPRDFRITIRQFFGDWERERPMHARVDLVGETPPPPVLTAAKAMADMKATGEWIENTVRFWQDSMDLFRRTPNQFQSWRKLTGDKVNATPGGDVANMYWNVPEGKALILRTRPPEAEYWNIEFNNPWWETMDYVHRLSGVNIDQATLEYNGDLIAVIAHKDPGVPNWLDTSGFLEGMIGRRWIFAKTLPEIECKVVPHDALFKHLPKTVKRITAAERTAQLAALRRGIYNRFNWL